MSFRHLRYIGYKKSHRGLFVFIPPKPHHQVRILIFQIGLLSFAIKNNPTDLNTRVRLKISLYEKSYLFLKKNTVRLYRWASKVTG